MERTYAMMTTTTTTTTTMYRRRDDVSKIYVLLRCMESVEAGKKKESGRRQKTRGRREGWREGGRPGGGKYKQGRKVL